MRNFLEVMILVTTTDFFVENLLERLFGTHYMLNQWNLHRRKVVRSDKERNGQPHKFAQPGIWQVTSSRKQQDFSVIINSIVYMLLVTMVTIFPPSLFIFWEFAGGKSLFLEVWRNYDFTPSHLQGTPKSK